MSSRKADVFCSHLSSILVNFSVAKCRTLFLKIERRNSNVGIAVCRGIAGFFDILCGI